MCNPGLVNCWLRSRLADFQSRYRGFWLEIVPSDATREERARAAHMAIHYGHALSGLHCELMVETAYFPVCSPKLLEGPNALKTLDDLCHHTLLHESATAFWGQWLKHAGAPGLSSTAPC